MNIENPIISGRHFFPDPQDKEVKDTCNHCHSDLHEGTVTVINEGFAFCDTHCLQEHLLENTVYEEIIL